MQVVPYKDLMAAVDVGTIRELEDLLISHCFYPRLITGSLDQRKACLQVPRPPPPPLCTHSVSHYALESGHGSSWPISVLVVAWVWCDN